MRREVEDSELVHALTEATEQPGITLLNLSANGVEHWYNWQEFWTRLAESRWTTSIISLGAGASAGAGVAADDPRPREVIQAMSLGGAPPLPVLAVKIPNVSAYCTRMEDRNAWQTWTELTQPMGAAWRDVQRHRGPCVEFAVRHLAIASRPGGVNGLSRWRWTEVGRGTSRVGKLLFDWIDP